MRSRFPLAALLFAASILAAGCACAPATGLVATQAAPCASVYASPCAQSQAVVYRDPASATAHAAVTLPGNLVGCLAPLVEGAGRSLNCMGDALIPKVGVPASSLVVHQAAPCGQVATYAADPCVQYQAQACEPEATSEVIVQSSRTVMVPQEETYMVPAKRIRMVAQEQPVYFRQRTYTRTVREPCAAPARTECVCGPESQFVEVPPTRVDPPAPQAAPADAPPAGGQSCGGSCGGGK